MEKSQAEPKLEKKEQKEAPKLKILVFDNTPVSQALKKVMGVLYGGAELAENKKSLIEKLERGEGDVVILKSSADYRVAIERIKQITAIRNKPKIKNQPVIITLGSIGTSKRHLEDLLNTGSDIVIEDVARVLEGLVGSMHSVPELLADIEDRYGDKMLINKKGFYKEYQDKLSARSQETADTEQELKILENIFKENNAKDILDAGGGEGRLAIPLAKKGYQVTSVDSSPELLEKMKTKTSEVEGVESDLRDLSLEEESFDAVTYNWHVFCDILGNKSKRKVLEEAHRVLREDGVVVLDLPDREQGEFKKDGVYINYPGGDNIFVGYVPIKEEMEQFLKEAGFKHVEIKEWQTNKGFPKVTFVAKK